jgi:hypothetical protein
VTCNDTDGHGSAATYGGEHPIHRRVGNMVTGHAQRSGHGHRGHLRGAGTRRRIGQRDGALLAQPAIVTVPVAFLVMTAVSLRDSRRGASAEMLALHAPEGLGLRLAEDDLDAPAAPASVMIER